MTVKVSSEVGTRNVQKFVRPRSISAGDDVDLAQLYRTSGQFQRILTKGRLVTLAAASGFVWPRPHITHCSLGLHGQSPNDITIGSAVLRTPLHSSKDFSVETDNPSKLTLPLGWLVGWLSGRTSVFGRRTFSVMRSTCSWWVTTYVGKPSAMGQPTRPTQPFIPSGSIDE